MGLLIFLKGELGMKFKFPKFDGKAIGRTLDIIGKFSKEHLPAILTICGIVGVTGSIIMTADAVKKSEEDIRQAEEESNAFELPNSENWIKMPRKEKIRLCWKRFIPGAGLYICSVGLIIAGQKVSLARLAAVTGLLQLRSKDFEDLKKKIIEKDGEKKLDEYRKAVEQDRIDANPPSNFLNTGHGSTIFFDPMSGNYFLSDIWHVQRAITHMIEAVKSENYYSLSDFYNDLDLPVKIECGQFFAFMYSTNSDLKIDHPEVLFDYNPVDADNGDTRPCIWLNYINRLDPSYEFEQEIRMKTPY